jgi:GNAT superfamily N-acetyltransferase
MAFVAIDADNGCWGSADRNGPDNEQAEFGILVRSSAQGKGLGHALLEK